MNSPINWGLLIVLLSLGTTCVGQTYQIRVNKLYSSAQSGPGDNGIEHSWRLQYQDNFTSYWTYTNLENCFYHNTGDNVTRTEVSVNRVVHSSTITNSFQLRLIGFEDDVNKRCDADSYDDHYYAGYNSLSSLSNYAPGVWHQASFGVGPNNDFYAVDYQFYYDFAPPSKPTLTSTDATCQKQLNDAVGLCGDCPLTLRSTLNSKNYSNVTYQWQYYGDDDLGIAREPNPEYCGGTDICSGDGPITQFNLVEDSEQIALEPITIPPPEDCPYTCCCVDPWIEVTKYNWRNITGATSLTHPLNTRELVGNNKRNTYRFRLMVKAGDITKYSSVISYNHIPEAPEFEVEALENSCISSPTGSVGINVLWKPGGSNADVIYRIGPDEIDLYNGTKTNENFNVENMAAGNYDVSLQVPDGCRSYKTVSVGEYLPIKASIETKNVTCNGSKNGEVLITISGGEPGRALTFASDVAGLNYERISNTQIRYYALGPGTYNFTVEDGNCSPPITVKATITEPDKITADAPVITNLSCSDPKNGTVYISGVKGGTGATKKYKYVLLQGTQVLSTSAITTNSSYTFTVAAGTYNVRIEDANQLGCHPLLITNLVVENKKLTAGAPVITNVICFGGSDGKVSIQGKDGLGSYTYTLTGNGVNLSNGNGAFTGLKAGAYDVKVANAGSGCNDFIEYKQIEIIQPEEIKFTSIAITDIKCYNSATGAISLTVSGGSGALSYQWYTATGTAISGKASEDISGLSAGKYKLKGTDARGCTKTSDVFEVIQPSELKITEVSATQIKCYGEKGTIAVTSNGGAGTRKYYYKEGINAWANFTSPGSFSAGDYLIKVEDGNGCSYEYPQTISITSIPTALNATTSTTDITCNGLSNGFITVNASGGNGTPYGNSYIYSINGAEYVTGGSSHTFSDLGEGSYTIKVKDERGCEITLSDQTIAMPLIVEGSASSVTNVECHGAETGQIVVNAQGGTGSYGYKINSGSYQSSNVFSNLKAGTHTITIKDSNGCLSSSFSQTITQPESAIQIKLSGFNKITCNNGSNGSITFTVTGGNDNNSLQWQVFKNGAWGNITGETSSKINNLASGTYRLKVTNDAGGDCDTFSESVGLANPEKLEFSSIKIKHITCKGDADATIDPTASGGWGSYKYFYSKDGSTNYVLFNSFTTFGPGNYEIKVTDSEGCSYTNTQTISITEPSIALSATLAAKNYNGYNISCKGAQDGQITVTPSGGNGGPFENSYTYSLNGGSFGLGNVFPSSKAGTYSIRVKDNRGCEIMKSISLTEPSELELSLSEKNSISCYGASTGFIKVTSSGGTSPYLWSINGGAFQSSSIFEGLKGGAYSLVTQDNNGCIKSINTIIEEPSKALSVSLTNTNISCHYSNDATITASVSGGWESYTLTWQKENSTVWENLSESSGSISNLNEGNYRIIVSDKEGCSVTSEEVLIINPEPIILSDINVSHVICKGENNGQITFSISGGWGNYTQEISSDGGTTFTSFDQNSQLSPGTYKIRIRDSGGCNYIYPSNIEISEPEQSLNFTYDLSNYNGSNISCKGASDGRIQINPTGGNGGDFESYYTYDIGNNEFTSTNFREGLQAGAYTLRLKDERGCIVSKEVILSQPSELKASLSRKNYISCFGDSTGFIEVGATGGIALYSYQLNNSEFKSHARFEDLAAGEYEIIVKDANGCIDSFSEVVNQPFEKLTIDFSKKYISCFEGNDGTISVISGGGRAPYSYSWTDINVDVSQRQSLRAGTYSLKITDSEGCSIEDSIHLSQPEALLMATVQASALLCNGDSDGEIQVIAAGGTFPYSYSFDDGVSYQSEAYINGLPAGDYKILIKDANQCLLEKSEKVLQPDTLKLSLVTQENVLCFGDSSGLISLQASGGVGGYQFKLNDLGYLDNNTFENLTATSYISHTLDSNGCSASLPIVIEQPDRLSVTIETTPLICKGDESGSISISTSGGVGLISTFINDQYFDNTMDGLSAGTYDLYLTDENQCIKDTVFSLIEPASSFSLEVQEQEDVSCYGLEDGHINLVTNGGYGNHQISFDGAEPNKTAFYDTMAVGTYTFVATDSLGCSQELKVSIQQPELLQLAVSEFTDVGCHGDSTGKISLEANGGNGNYNFNISGSIQQGTIFTGLSAGEYRLEVKDSKGCFDSLYQIISQPPPLTAEISSTLNAACGQANGEATINVGGGVPGYGIGWINWQEDTVAQGEFARELYAGKYWIKVIDENSCILELSHTIKDDEAPTIEVLENRPVTCYDGSDGFAEVQVTGAGEEYFYQWSDVRKQATPTADSLKAGDYSLRVEDNRGCVSSIDIFIETPDAVTVQEEFHIIPSCFGLADGELKVNAAGGNGIFTYQWQDGVSFIDNHASSLSKGDYEIAATDSNGCIGKASFLIDEPPLLVGDSARVQHPTCDGNCDGEISIYPEGGTGDYQIVWENLSFTGDSIDVLCEGAYVSIVTDENGCTASKTHELIAPEPLVMRVEKLDSTSCSYSNDGYVKLGASGGTYPYQYIWEDFQEYNESFHESLSKGNYSITIQDTLGCTDSMTVLIPAPDSIIIAVVETIEPLCQGDCNGAITVNADGGTGAMSFKWDDGAVSSLLSEVCAGDYSVRVFDENSCTAIQQITLGEPERLQLEIEDFGNVSCHEGSDGYIRVIGSGGVGNYGYYWKATDNASSSIIDIPAGSYESVLNDENGCKDSLIINIEQPAPIAIMLENSQIPSCKESCDGLISIAALGGNGGYKHEWIDIGQHENVATNICEGSYKIIVTDSLACQGDSTFHLKAPHPLAIDVLTSIEPECNGDCSGEIEVFAFGGTAPYQYNWISPAPLQGTGGSGLCADIYTVEVLDVNECFTEQKIILDGPDVMELIVLDKVSPSCAEAEDGSIRVASYGGTAPYTYEWISTGQSGKELKNIKSGIYPLKITDAMGCVLIKEIELTAPTPLSLDLKENVSPLCSYSCDGYAEVIPKGGTGPYSYKWNDSNFQTTARAENLCDGDYTVTIADSKGCAFTQTITIEATPEIEIDLGGSRTLCKDQEATLDPGKQDFVYHWTSDNDFKSDAQVVTLNKAGNYYLEAISPLGCIARDTFEVFVEEKSFEVNFLAASELIAGDTLLLTEVCFPVADYLEWGFEEPVLIVDANDAQPQISYPTAGTYPVSLTAYHGECYATITKEITFYDPDEAPDLNGRIALGETGIKNVKLFPNPTHGKVNVEVTMHKPAPLASFIYDNNGVELYRMSREKGLFFRMHFDISRERNGVYYIKLVSNNDMENIKIIKSQ